VNTFYLFLSLGGGEIVIILLFILMFFGAKSIPSLARGLGRGIRQVKDASQEIQRDIRESATKMRDEVEDISKDNED
jgi:sec-independent protein translocase protein TatA